MTTFRDAVARAAAGLDTQERENVLARTVALTEPGMVDVICPLAVHGDWSDVAEDSAIQVILRLAGRGLQMRRMLCARS